MNNQILDKDKQLLNALAIVGWGNADLLSTIVNNQLSAELLTKLALHPAVSVEGVTYCLAEAMVKQSLQHFERDDYATYKLWHQRAIMALAASK